MRSDVASYMHLPFSNREFDSDRRETLGHRWSQLRWRTNIPSHLEHKPAEELCLVGLMPDICFAKNKDQQRCLDLVQFVFMRLFFLTYRYLQNAVIGSTSNAARSNKPSRMLVDSALCLVGTRSSRSSAMSFVQKLSEVVSVRTYRSGQVVQ